MAFRRPRACPARPHPSARRLALRSDCADALLLLGPLYHLVEASDRAAALAEARGVTRPGGLVAAAAPSPSAGLLDLAARGPLDEQTEPLLRVVIATGHHDARLGFAPAHFIRRRSWRASSKKPNWARSWSSASRGRPAPRSTRTGWNASASCCPPRSAARASPNATRADRGQRPPARIRARVEPPDPFGLGRLRRS